MGMCVCARVSPYGTGMARDGRSLRLRILINVLNGSHSVDGNAFSCHTSIVASVGPVAAPVLRPLPEESVGTDPGQRSLLS